MQSLFDGLIRLKQCYVDSKIQNEKQEELRNARLLNAKRESEKLQSSLKSLMIEHRNSVKDEVRSLKEEDRAGDANPVLMVKTEQQKFFRQGQMHSQKIIDEQEAQLLGMKTLLSTLQSSVKELGERNRQISELCEYQTQKNVENEKMIESLRVQLKEAKARARQNAVTAQKHLEETIVRLSNTSNGEARKRSPERSRSLSLDLSSHSASASPAPDSPPSRLKRKTQSKHRKPRGDRRRKKLKSKFVIK